MPIPAAGFEQRTPALERSVVFKTLGEDEWSGILTTFNDAVFFQTLAYGAVRWGLPNVRHIVVEREGEPVAAAQIRMMRGPVGVAYQTWGPMFRRGGASDLDAFRQALKAMRLELVEKRGLCIRLRPFVMEDDAPALAALSEEGYRRSRTQELYQTYVLDLTGGVDAVWKASDRTWREKTRRAEKQGLVFRCGTGPEYFDAFFRVYDEMHGAKGFAEYVQARDFARMQEMLPERMKMRVALCEKNGEPASALVYSDIGETAVALLAASGALGRQHTSAYMMWWRTVEELAAKGVRAFDLGGADPVSAPGPARFKHYLVGKKTPLVRHAGHFEAGSPVNRLIVNAGFSARNACRKLKALRMRFARMHFGGKEKVND